MPPPKNFLQKIGVDKSTAYLICLMVSGGGYVEKAHVDATSTIQAQIAELNTSLALSQQSAAMTEKRLDAIDHDLRALTRAFDKNVKQAVATN